MGIPQQETAVHRTADACRPRRALRPVIVLGFALLSASCSGDGADAEASAAAPSQGVAQRNRACALFTRDEIGSRLGTSVGDGYVAGPMNSACQWDATRNDDAYAHIELVSAEYWSKPHGARGYEALGGIGREGYVVPELGGWGAGSLLDSMVVAVAVTGGTSNKDTAIRLLRDAIARLERR